MNFDKVTHFLEKRLVQNLPGNSAHELMKPRMADGTSFSITHPTHPREGGVLILFYEAEGVVKFPLIQRTTYEGIHSGQIALPGGKKEDEDGNLKNTALREAYEEIGIDLEEVEIIGSLSKFFVIASNYCVLPVIGKVAGIPRFTPDPREVEGILHPSLSTLTDPSSVKEKQMRVRGGVDMICPYYDLEEKVVWGATAMMLSELVSILSEYKED